MSHPTTRVLDIAGMAWDQVNVAVEDRLAGSFAAIDADVEAGDRRVCGLERNTLLVHQALDRGPLRPVQVEPANETSSW